MQLNDLFKTIYTFELCVLVIEKIRSDNQNFSLSNELYLSYRVQIQTNRNKI